MFLHEIPCPQHHASRSRARRQINKIWNNSAHRFLNNYNNLLFALTFPAFAAWSIYLISGWWLGQLRPRDLGDLIATWIEEETGDSLSWVKRWNELMLSNSSETWFDPVCGFTVAELQQQINCDKVHNQHSWDSVHRVRDLLESVTFAASHSPTN